MLRSDSPLAVSVASEADRFVVELSDGRAIAVPYAYSTRLMGATSEQRADYELIGRGDGIHWPQIDEDLSVAGLLRGLMPSGAQMLRAYDADFAGWAEDTAAAIEQGRFDEIDRASLAEEVASLSRTAKRELRSALRLLLTHLLKARYQPEKHTRSWDDTTRRERRRALEFLAESPSLKSHIDALFAEAYEDAVYQAESETGLSLATFPPRCEWTLAEVLEAGA